MTRHFELFLDESGDFCETSLDQAERDRGGNRRSAPSQLAGIVAPAGRLKPDRAASIVAACREAYGLPANARLHGTELRSGDSYDAMVVRLAETLERGGLQPVRFVNRERVTYGDRVANDTNLMAELAVRLWRELRRGTESGTIELTINRARVFLGEDDDGTLQFIETDDYRRRLQEAVTRAAVLRGLPIGASPLVIRKVRLGSGREWPELQACDLVSNASYRNFRRCGAEAKARLIDALGLFDMTVIAQPLLERVTDLMAEDALGLAAVTLGRRLTEADSGGELRESARSRLEELIGRLAREDVRQRETELRQVLAWATHVVETDRDRASAIRVLPWIEKHLVEPLFTALLDDGGDPASTRWLAFDLNTLALESANHAGDVGDARARANRLHQMLPDMAGRWEHAPRLIEGLVHEAVHLTDCGDFDGAAALMEQASRYYEDLSELFHAALPDVFPEQVRSELHGRVLGTWLQAELFAGLRERSRLARARKLSDRAIEQLSEDDQLRQFQYRCQIEAADGNLAEARSYLARSLRLEEDDQLSIASAIKRLETRQRGFPLLHWMRIGVAAHRASDRHEFDAFMTAARRTSLIRDAWTSGEIPSYPAHGILRCTAYLHAATGGIDDSLSAAARLRDLESLAKGQLPLTLVLLATQLEVAGLVAPSRPDLAGRLLDDQSGKRPGATQVLAALIDRAGTVAPRLAERLEPWRKSIVEAAHGRSDSAATTVLRLAAQVGF